MKSALLLSILMIFSVSCSHKKKSPENTYTPVVSFEENGETFESKVILPKKFKDRIPLVIVIHEWWGKTEHPMNSAQKLADVGYAALPVDLFGGKTASNPKDAMALATPFYQDPQKSITLLNKYLEIIRKDPHIDPSKIYVIGYCFGGTQALNLARSGANVKGVVSFHGGLTTTMTDSKILPKILVLHGGADPMVPPKEVKAFEKEMKKAGGKYKLITYPGATHAFTNPKATEIGKTYNIPIAYSEKAAQDSWKELLKFLKQ